MTRSTLTLARKPDNWHDIAMAKRSAAVQAEIDAAVAAALKRSHGSGGAARAKALPKARKIAIASAGGRAAAAKLTPGQRSEAARQRWITRRKNEAAKNAQK